MKFVFHLLYELGSVATFFFRTLQVFFKTKGNFKPILEQITRISIQSLPTVAFSGIFVGAILVLQFDLILAKYDALSFLGGLNTSSVIREVGPLLISFLLAGKIGAFTAAELGTMRVTEQIDAIECLGADPMQYLVVPRFIGIVISSLILLQIGLVVSIGGSIVIANLLCGLNPLQFIAGIPRFTNGWTIFGGAFKSFVYGLIVAAVSCHQGFTTSGGAKGVGKAVTRAAIFTNFYIVIANSFTSNLLEMIYELTT